MIVLQNIGKIYQSEGVETEALCNINLNIDQGEFLAVTGTSGSGKTTLLNILGAMDRATSGSYQFEGQEISTLSASAFHKFRRENVSFVFQHFELMKNYTVYENVEMPLLIRNVKNRKKIIMESLEMLGIADLATKKPPYLSGGQQQRCAIARALAAGTKLILADEPTGALDGKTGGDMMDVLCRLNETGKTIILITHDMEIASRCKRIIQLEDGRIKE